MGMLNALNLGDVTNEMLYQLRPYEMVPGETERAFAEVMDTLGTFLRERKHFEILEQTPPWLSSCLARQEEKIERHAQYPGQDTRTPVRQCLP